jgi:hypothetical protein
MQAGDLVIVDVLAYVGAGNTLGISDTGGQLWTSETQVQSTVQAFLKWRRFWCVWDGAWDANPVFYNVEGNATVLQATMLVFRPPAGETVSVDVNPSTEHYAAGTTITHSAGISVVTTDALVLATWWAMDDNTWSSLQAGFSTPGGQAQFRNNSASQDTALAHGYKLTNAIGGTGSVANTQSAADNCSVTLQAWKSVAAAPSGHPTMQRWGGSIALTGGRRLGRGW